MKVDFKNNGSNQVLNIEDGVYISFNPAPCQNMGFLKSDEGSSETALYIDGEFYILNGDFRKQYKTAASSGDKVANCIGVYQNYKKKYRSTWSSDSDFKEFLLERIKNA